MKEVRIGNQIWMAENLNVDKFRNGDPIPHAKTEEEWRRAGENNQPAWCYIDNDPAVGKIYGKLYNWYAVSDRLGLAPEGWRIPDDDNWQKMVELLGGGEAAGGKLKETGTSHWKDPNFAATNETGFTALPGGARNYYGKFSGIGYNGFWWSATENGSHSAWDRLMFCDYSRVGRESLYKDTGFSVRCVRD